MLDPVMAVTSFMDYPFIPNYFSEINILLTSDSDIIAGLHRD